MYDVHVIFSDRPGELARFGQLLGRHGVGREMGEWGIRAFMEPRSILGKNTSSVAEV